MSQDSEVHLIYKNRWGPGLWHGRLSCCLGHQQPRWLPTAVLTAVLLTNSMLLSPVDQQQMPQVLGPLLPTRGAPGSWLWPGLGLAIEATGAVKQRMESISLCLSFNKYLNTHTHILGPGAVFLHFLLPALWSPQPQNRARRGVGSELCVEEVNEDLIASRDFLCENFTAGIGGAGKLSANQGVTQRVTERGQWAVLVSLPMTLGSQVHLCVPHLHKWQ